MGNPLAGLRVLEMAGLGPAPFAGMLLADLGADVVRVDRVEPGGALPPVGLDLLGRGKRSIGLDLKSASGVATVRELAARADAFIEGFRPGVAERLGIGPAQLLAANPRLVYGRMTGWGQDGPLARTAGHDLAYLALTGVLHAIGPAGAAPVPPLNLLGDFGGGGMLLAVGVLAGIVSAGRTGRGQLVDASIVDGTALLGTFVFGMLHSGTWHDARGANLLDGGAPFYAVYETSDGRYLAVGALEPKFYAVLVAGLDGLGDDAPAQYDPAGWPVLRERIAARIASRTRDEWVAVFDGTDACVAPVLSLSEAAANDHPQLAARRTFVSVDGVAQPAAAPRFAPATGDPATRDPAVPGRPPWIGEHTDEVCSDWLA
jgi:alpha-methylacyl-CoA racemase